MSRYNLLIVGSGSQARYVIDILFENQGVNILGIADVEDACNIGRSINNIPIICFVDEIPRRFSPQECKVIVAYGKNDRKREIVTMLAEHGFQFATAISPIAYVSPYAEIGEGCIINPIATIMPNAQIGRHVIIHSQAVIEHDNIIGDYVNIGPGVSLGGNVHIGEGSYIYTGASIIPKVVVGKWAVVAAGAVVIHNVPDFDTVAGVPAKSIKDRR